MPDPATVLERPIIKKRRPVQFLQIDSDSSKDMEYSAWWLTESGQSVQGWGVTVNDEWQFPSETSYSSPKAVRQHSQDLFATLVQERLRHHWERLQLQEEIRALRRQLDEERHLQMAHETTNLDEARAGYGPPASERPIKLHIIGRERGTFFGSEDGFDE